MKTQPTSTMNGVSAVTVLFYVHVPFAQLFLLNHVVSFLVSGARLWVNQAVFPNSASLLQWTCYSGPPSLSSGAAELGSLSRALGTCPVLGHGFPRASRALKSNPWRLLRLRATFSQAPLLRFPWGSLIHLTISLTIFP